MQRCNRKWSYIMKIVQVSFLVLTLEAYITTRQYIRLHAKFKCVKNDYTTWKVLYKWNFCRVISTYIQILIVRKSNKLLTELSFKARIYASKRYINSNFTRCARRIVFDLENNCSLSIETKLQYSHDFAVLKSVQFFKVAKIVESLHCKIVMIN